MVNWLYHSSGLFDVWILSLLTCQRWIVNSPAFSLVELHFFIQRCSKEFIPRWIHRNFHGSRGVGPSRFRKKILIKYLFAVKMPLNKYRWIWGPVRCWIREKNTWYIVTVCKLSSNETTWSQNQGGFQSQIPPGIHQKFALRAALCSSNSSCVLGPRHALLPLQSPSAQRIQTALRLKDVKPTRPQHLFYREGV